METNRRKTVAVVGAGMSGPLVACFLARRGFDATIYERRDDPRTAEARARRSIQMTLSHRGLSVLELVDAKERVLERTVPVTRRMIHHLDGTEEFQPYGKNDQEILHAISRNDLSLALLEHALEEPGVKVEFLQQVEGVDAENGSLELEDLETGARREIRPDMIVGADGAYSSIRETVQKGQRADFSRQYLECGYKQLDIPPGPDGDHQLDGSSLHIWPRGAHMLLAIPDRRGSLNCLCILPYEGEHSFDTVTTPEDVRALFERFFPDALGLIPNLEEQFASRPIGFTQTVLTHPWSRGDNMVLLGDAVHSIVPYYGQGMNASLEDCLCLDRCLEEHPDDWQTAFRRFEELRKPHTDTIARLALDNFVELRDTVRRPLLVPSKKAEMLFHRLMPERLVPLYTLICHTSIPYGDALALYQAQRRRARWLGLDLLTWGFFVTDLVGRGFQRLFGHRGGRSGRRSDSSVPDSVEVG